MHHDFLCLGGRGQEMEEKAKLRVEIDGEDAKTTLQELKQESSEINRELKRMKEAGEEGSEGWKELKNRQKEVNSEMSEYIRHLDVNDASMKELTSKSRLLNRELKDLKIGSEEWLEKLSEVRKVDDKIAETTKAVKGLGDEVEKQPSMWEGMKGSILAVFTGTGLLDLAKAAGTAIWDFGKEVFETTAKFEGYETVLRVALGSQEKAVKAMSDIKKMAAETPFSVDELTESYVKYVNRGLTPTMAEMTKMGDIAASQGKSFDQLTEAILDATTGEFERLKEFGIHATKSNGEVELSFKGVTKVVKDQPEAIRQAMLSFGELEGVQGGMAETSKTLNGRLSNLGDNFDALKILIGEGLKPVFGFLIDVMSTGIDVVKGLFSGSSQLTPVFEAIMDVVGNLWDTMKSYFGTLFDGAKDSGILKAIMDQLVGTIKVVATAFLLALTGTQAFYDGLNAVINKGKELANFFGAEFKIDPKANFDTLQKNAEKNFKSIENMWTGTSAKNVKTHETDTKKQTDTHAKGQAAQTLAEKKEADKRAKARETQAKKDEKAADKTRKDELKAEDDLIKKIDAMKIKSIKDDKTRKIAEITASAKREADAIKASLASDKKKQEALKLLSKQTETEIAKTEEDFRKKKETEEDALRKKTAAEEKRLRDEKLKETKAMFDAEFQAEMAKAKNALDLTSENSKAQWDAKRAFLDTEYKFKIQQLKNEDAAEKARLTESIKDNDARAKALEASDVELKAKMSSAENKLQAEKTKLNEDQNKARQKNNEEFFDALKKAGEGDLKATMEFLKKKADEDKLKNKDRKEDKVKLKEAFAGLMKGDSELFQKYMVQSIKTDKDGNATKLQAFADKTQKVADIATAAIGALKDMNQKYLEWEIGKIKKEEQEQLDSWKREYEGGKMSKEEFEAGNVKITKESKEKELAARKDAFEREKKMNIAAAVINTAQAALKSFAMFGWPIGLIMAALAAVAGGIQIAAISRQQFTGKQGGVVNSIGKIFAGSGAVIPKNAFVAQGDLHGNSYGMGGISMVNRKTGQEIGEIEGGEPVMVLSRNTYANNGPLIDKLLKSSLYKNGAPITMAKGGVMSASGNRMYGDGGLVDTGVNVDGMMEENKKSQETMEKMKENTAETAKQVSNLNQTMQRQAQQQGGFNMQVARAFMDEIQHLGRVMQGVQNQQVATNQNLDNVHNRIIAAMRSNTQSISDIIRMELRAIQSLMGRSTEESFNRMENIASKGLNMMNSNHQSLISTIRNELRTGQNQVERISNTERNQLDYLAQSMFTMIRSNQQSWNDNFRNENRRNRELSEEQFRQKWQHTQYMDNLKAERDYRFHQDDQNQRTRIFNDTKKVTTQFENNRHRDAIDEMMLQRMLQNELNWHGSILMQIRDKPDGSGSILHAIGRLEANAAKSNLK